ncbi:MAG: hypothetical protein R2795_07830 [Saprospiraceae bacterium]
MARKTEETASFVIRMTQKIYQNEEGENEVQWLGYIHHVQGGAEKRFASFDQAVSFIQEKLTELTLAALQDKTPEEQKGILAKSLDIWKKVATTGPKLIADTLKDPQKQMAHLTEQLQEQFISVKEEIEHKLDWDSWLVANRADAKQTQELLQQLTRQVAALEKQVAALSAKK